MIDPQTSAGIAETVFYVPVVPITLYILVRNWNHRPRMAWYPLFIFSLFRLIGGILLIVLEYQPDNVALIATTIVILNVGVIPLIIATIGVLRIVLSSENWHANRIQNVIKLIRIILIIQVALIVTGGSLVASSKTLETGRTLPKVTYLLFICVIACLCYLVVRLYKAPDHLSAADRKYLLGTAVSIPLIAIRTVYGILQQFFPDPLSTWNPVFGSAVAFTLMALLPEYVIVLVDIWLGFVRMRDWSTKSAEPNGETTLQNV